MKKSMLSSYMSGLVDTQHGESYSKIMRYFFPEFICALVVYSLPFWIDAWFIGQLASTPAFATLGTTNNLIHFMFKLAESFSVGTVIMTGQFNGQKAYDRVGRTVRDAFWSTCLVGLFFAGSLYYGAYYVYRWYGLPAEMAEMSIPFLQLRAVGVLFLFMYMALVGFLRGIKENQIPMIAFMCGAVIFLLADYMFIFGNWGAPALGLQGSALASVIQYSSMFFIACGYIVTNKKYRKYGLELFRGVSDLSYIKHLMSLSWPIMVDKASMAWAYIWLTKMINPMGTCVIASYCALKDMERCAFLPAVAFAQVITFLVSNDAGVSDWESIKANLKKVCFLATMMVSSTLALFALNPASIIRFFDKKGEFTLLAVRAFPLISVLVLLDLVQLILAGALRGAGDVRTVMYTRVLICLGYFVPLSYLLSNMQMPSTFLKFVLIYSSFYVGNAIMSIIYINRLRNEAWKVSSVEGNV